MTPAPHAVSSTSPTRRPKVTASRWRRTARATCSWASELASAAAQLRQAASAREAVLLSTCNRTEVYLVEGATDAAGAAWAALSERLGSDVTGYGAVHRDREAAAHLFRVTAGLDSMILGEAQIHG